MRLLAVAQRHSSHKLPFDCLPRLLHQKTNIITRALAHFFLFFRRCEQYGSLPCQSDKLPSSCHRAQEAQVVLYHLLLRPSIQLFFSSHSLFLSGKWVIYHTRYNKIGRWMRERNKICFRPEAYLSFFPGFR